MLNVEYRTSNQILIADGQGDLLLLVCGECCLFYRSRISQYWLVVTIYVDAFSVFIIFSVKHVSCFRTKVLCCSLVHSSYMYLDDF